ncbi:hypothetical protein HMPREF3190_01506 [Umbribacter vaginalis]|nr:hypothetical protein HMPREF3190_01506 [Coriobacteriales bacterium DNF00809]
MYHIKALLRIKQANFARFSQECSVHNTTHLRMHSTTYIRTLTALLKPLTLLPFRVAYF